MLKIPCRLWNLSILSVLILTFSNILLTVRLLHSDCSKSTQPTTEEGKSLGKLRPAPLIQPSSETITSRILCKDSNNSSKGVRYEHDSKNVLEIDIRLGRWDSRRMFKMFDFVYVGEEFPQLSQEFSVCLATQSSLEKLYSLVQVAHQWTGPISAALYAAGDEYKLLQWYVEFLIKCFPNVRDRVSFHLAVPKDKLFPNDDTDLPHKPPELDCRRPETVLQQLLQMRKGETYRWRIKAAYPQNHLRNLARRNCQGEFVFLTDVDIIPSYHLAEGLDVFLKNANCNGLCAYVIPTYELDERVRFPRNKSDLVRLAKKGLARPFHQKVFIYNQYATNFSRWQATAGNEPSSVHISHNVTNFEFLYEPFYVAPDTVPPHDERFIGYGYTRNTQVYEMYVAGYNFQVLSPIFTCHWGLQVKKNRPSWREKQNSMNRKHFDTFKAEVFARYRKDPLKMLGGKKPGTHG